MFVTRVNQNALDHSTVIFTNYYILYFFTVLYDTSVLQKDVKKTFLAFILWYTFL